MNLRVAATAALVSVLDSAARGFICPSYQARRPRLTNLQLHVDNRSLKTTNIHALQKKSSISVTLLRGQVSNDRKEDNDELEELPSEDGAENFDGKGFLGYLAPYAFAFLVASIVTGLFFRFVLMADY